MEYVLYSGGGVPITCEVLGVWMVGFDASMVISRIYSFYIFLLRVAS